MFQLPLSFGSVPVVPGVQLCALREGSLTSKLARASPRITRVGAVSYLQWRLGGKKVGFTLRLIRRADRNLGRLRVLESSTADNYILQPSLTSQGYSPYAGSILKGRLGGSCPAPEY
eukprot:1147898-Pelagomonas_calceolata.AAC.3